MVKWGARVLRVRLVSREEQKLDGGGRGVSEMPRREKYFLKESGQDDRNTEEEVLDEARGGLRCAPV